MAFYIQNLFIYVNYFLLTINTIIMIALNFH